VNPATDLPLKELLIVLHEIQQL